jgi:hypothetical protein
VNDEVGARMDRGERRDLERVEYAENIQFALLREVCRVGEEGE